MTTQHFVVTGMTCEHCVASVTEEVSEIRGVRSVAVDLASGALSIDAQPPVEEADVRAAVAEAGYRLVP